MPADPETLVAINALSNDMRNLVEKHAKEARDEQRENTAELRGSIITLGTQVTDLASRFGSHEKAAAKEIERLDDRIDAIEVREQAAAERTEGRLLTAAKVLLSGGAGAAIWEILKGNGK